MKKYIFILSLLFVTCFAFAVPATPNLLSKIQPDGQKIHYFLHGDEIFSYQTTEDGCLILENAAGFFEYAIMDYSGTVHSLGVRVADRMKDTSMIQSEKEVAQLVQVIRSSKLRQRNIQFKSITKPRKYPLVGSPKSLVILAEYSDVSFTVNNPQVAYTDLLNEENYSKNGGVGSAKDYFKASSNDVFAPNFVVVGPYKLPNNQKFYGEPNGTQHDRRATQMIIDVCKAADADIDFSEYDTDNDGQIDNVFVYYAGHNEAEGASENTVWPHRFKVYDNVILDGKQLYDYACTSELSGPSGTRMCGIGTFAHEFGHVLGLPDYYDTSGNRNNPYVPGSWNIMSSGSYNGGGKTPPAYSAEDRFFLGWLQPVQIIAGGQYALSSLNTSNTAYLLTTKTSNLQGNNPDPVEYFLLENRQRDEWDTPSTCVPGTGLLITHIHYNSRNWRYNSVNNDLKAPGYVVVRADGSSSFSNLDGDPFPGKERISEFVPKLQDGQDIKLPLTNIIENDGNIMFSVAGGDGRGLNVTKIMLDFVDPYTQEGSNKTISYQELSSYLVGKKLSESVEISFESGTDFLLKQEDGSFSNAKRIVSLDKDSIELNIEIKFNPTLINCSKKTSDRLIIKSGNYIRHIILTGSTPRKNILVAPILEDPLDVSRNSFSIQWNTVEDAEYYFVTIDEVDENPKTYIEKFDDFGSSTFNKDWTANFNTSSVVYVKSKPKAVWFRNNKDQLVTPKYNAELTDISFWLSSVSAQGKFVVEGQIENTWDTIALETISSTIANKTYAYDLSKEYNQFRMTYFSDGIGSGVVIDDFTANATLVKTPVVVRERVMGTSYNALGLKSGKIYFASVEAGERKGCNLKISPKSNVQRVEMEGSVHTTDSKLSVSYESNKVYLIINQYDSDNDSGKFILIYDLQGHLIYELPVQSDSMMLPALLKGSTYIAVFTNKDKQVKNADSVTFYY